MSSGKLRFQNLSWLSENMKMQLLNQGALLSIGYLSSWEIPNCQKPASKSKFENILA